MLMSSAVNSMQTRNQMSWIKWRACSEPNPATRESGESEKVNNFSGRQINSKTNYPCYWSFARINEKERRETISTHLGHRAGQDQVSIDRSAQVLPVRNPQSPRKASQEKGRVSGRSHKTGVPPERGRSNFRKIRTEVTTSTSPVLNYDVALLDQKHKRELKLHNACRQSLHNLSTMGACDDVSYCDTCISECENVDNLSERNVFSCELCRQHMENINHYSHSTYGNSTRKVNNIGSPNKTSPAEHEQNCDCCMVISNEEMKTIHNVARRRIANHEEVHQQPRMCVYCYEDNSLYPRHHRHTPIRAFNKFIRKKYHKFRNRFRSKSLPPFEETTTVRRARNQSHSLVEVDCNMNQRCSICERDLQDEEYESDWENLLACSCKSKSLLNLDNLSLFAHPTPSERGGSECTSCDCCQGNFLSHLDIDESYAPSVGRSDNQSLCPSYCEQCARITEMYPEVFCKDCELEACGRVRYSDGLISSDFLTVGEMKKFGGMPRNSTVKHQQPKLATKTRSKKKRRRRIKSESAPMDRWVDNLGLCLQCVFPKHGFRGSESGASGSDGDNDSEEGEPEEEYEEHGDEASDNDDSDGGDSGSGTIDVESMNSAELFDDTMNALDNKDNNALEGSDGGGDGPGSECTDSLTELGSDDSETSGSSDDDDADSCFDYPEDDASGGMDSLQSILICERE